MAELIRVTRGVWRPADTVDDLLGRCAALLAALPPMTVIGGMAAARLHSLWLPDTPIERIDVLLRNDGSKPRRRAGCIRGEVCPHRRSVRPDEIVLIDGVPVASETRVWVDLAPVLPMPDLVAAGDSVLRGNAAADLDEMIRRAAGRRGVRKARAARELLSPFSRSRPESHLRYGLVSSGLPMPEVNQPVHGKDGRWLAEPDLLYRDARLAMEYNGRDHADVRRMRADITRALDILDEDWLTLVFGPAQVFGRPDHTASLVRRHLDLRDPGWWRRVAS